jgi:rhodanese-related sulfurtransferase
MLKTKNKSLIREVGIIIVMSIFLALVYNVFSSKGIPLIRKEIKKNAASDSLLFAYANQVDSLKLMDNRDTAVPKNIKVIAPLHERALKNPDSVAKLYPRKHDPVWKIISLGQLNRLLVEKRAILIDARSEEEFKKGHILGARNIPGLEPEKYVEQIIAQPRDTLIIIYCNNPECHLGQMLADFLSVMEFKNLYLYDDGWDGWKKAQMSTDTSFTKEKSQ